LTEKIGSDDCGILNLAAQNGILFGQGIIGLPQPRFEQDSEVLSTST
jgi:hypothetical protein